MKKILASCACVLLLAFAIPALAFQSHPKPHKVAKHKTKGDHRRHFFKKKS